MKNRYNSKKSRVIYSQYPTPYKKYTANLPMDLLSKQILHQQILKLVKERSDWQQQQQQDLSLFQNLKKEYNYIIVSNLGIAIGDPRRYNIYVI